MSKRMTDERLAEIEIRDRIPFLESIIQEGRKPSDAERDRRELLQALKAEREYVEELEDRWGSFPADQQELVDLLHRQKDRIKELETDRYGLAVKNFDQAKRIAELQRKCEALVKRITALPDKWRSEYPRSVAIGCADELERALLDDA